MVEQPLLRVSPRDIDTLLSTLEVRFVALSECLVSAGFRLEMGGVDAPGIHYNIGSTFGPTRWSWFRPTAHSASKSDRRVRDSIR
jgi:hypothetical protein